MPIIPEILGYQQELMAIRRDIHAHPELAFAEQRTSDLSLPGSSNSAARSIAVWPEPG